MIQAKYCLLQRKEKEQQPYLPFVKIQKLRQILFVRKNIEHFSEREHIIYESIESLRKEGLRFSIDTLAERLNISKKTIYKYFPNKEALAFALYQRYYTDIKAQADQLAAEGSVAAHIKLLTLYFDAKSMTGCDVFNKYKLNKALYSYTTKQNDDLWEIILSSLDNGIPEQDKESFYIIVNGSFEKLCHEKIAPNGVIDRLVNILWK